MQQRQNIHSSQVHMEHFLGQLGHKTNLSIFKSTKIIQTMFSNYNGMKLGNDNRESTLGNSQTCGN